MPTLPTAKPAQASILSFFHQKQPKYAPPPPKTFPGATQQQQVDGVAGHPPAPPPPPSSEPRPHPPPSAAKSASSPPLPPPTTAAAAAEPPPSSPPHPQASIRPVSASDITALRRINSLLLPVAYPDSFYQHILDPSISALFSRVITWSEPTTTAATTTIASSAPKVVGGIVCRVEHVAASAQDDAYQVLYIQSLCLLSPYRSLGLASAALDHVLAAARRDPSLDVRCVYAHVWTDNEDGLAWYRARGFTCSEEPIEGYYFKLKPDSAWVVQRDLLPLQKDGEQPGRDGQQESAPPAPVQPSTTADLANLPPPRGGSGDGPPRGQSFQNQGPGAEWNDLPADMAPAVRGTAASSEQSSRSSSAVRKKRDRTYPAEAFGS